MYLVGSLTEGNKAETRKAHKNRVFIINLLSATSIWVKVKFRVKVKFEVKVELGVKVKLWAKVKFEVKVKFGVKFEFGVKVKFGVKVTFWVKVKFGVKVKYWVKVNVCVVASGFARWSMSVCVCGCIWLRQMSLLRDAS